MSAGSRQGLKDTSSTAHRKATSHQDTTTRCKRCRSTPYSSRPRDTPRTHPGSHGSRCRTRSDTAPSRCTPLSRSGQWGKAHNATRSDRPNHPPRNGHRTGGNRRRTRSHKTHPRCTSPNHWQVKDMAHTCHRSVAVRMSPRTGQRTHGTLLHTRTRARRHHTRRWRYTARRDRTLRGIRHQRGCNRRSPCTPPGGNLRFARSMCPPDTRRHQRRRSRTCHSWTDPSSYRRTPLRNAPRQNTPSASYCWRSRLASRTYRSGCSSSTNLPYPSRLARY